MRHSASIIGSVAAVALTALLAAAPASAQSIVSPVAVPVNTLGDFDGTADILQTIDHSGLSSNFISGVTNFNTYIGTNPTHTTSFSGNEWFSPIGVLTGTIVYDLGVALNIDRLAIWNEETNGITTMTVSASNDVTFSSGVTNLGVFAPTNNPDGSDYPADVFAFANTNARFVRLVVVGTGPTFTSMGEIAFRSVAAGQAAPEPGTVVLLAVGILGGAIVRRKKAAGR